MCRFKTSIKRSYRTMEERWQNATHQFGCGKCVQCQRKRKNSWVFRLTYEQKRSTSAAFITYTYENTPLSSNGIATLRKKDLTDYHKRLRTHIKRNQDLTPNQKPLKYYSCGEYGTNTFRPHYHEIIFNLPQSYIENPQILANIWGKGHIKIGTSKGGSIQYVAKYCMKSTPLTEWVNQDTGELFEIEKEFSLMSKGLGDNYITPETIKFHKERLETLVHVNGQEMSLPRYYRDKIFTKSELKIINESIQEAQQVNLEIHFNNDELQFEKYNARQEKLDRIKLNRQRITL